MKYATPRTENSVCIDTFPTAATIHMTFTTADNSCFACR